MRKSRSASSFSCWQTLRSEEDVPAATTRVDLIYSFVGAGSETQPHTGDQRLTEAA